MIRKPQGTFNWFPETSIKPQVPCRRPCTLAVVVDVKSGAGAVNSMHKPEILRFRDALLDISSKPTTAWVYLPADKNWNLNSESAVLESEEVPPEMEDQPDAGVPEFAKQHQLIQALPVTVIQDIVTNARAQKPNANIDDLFRAFEYYYKHDAFAKLT